MARIVTTAILETECIGDSLATINTNFESLDTKVAEVSATISGSGTSGAVATAPIGGGTTNKVTKWGSGSALVDSSITDDGTKVKLTSRVDQVLGGGSDYYNTAFGNLALSSRVAGSTTVNNTAFGRATLSKNTTGEYNTAVGADALEINTSGDSNVAVGSNALDSNTTGYMNVAVGRNTLHTNLSGHDNVAIGNDALSSNIGDYQTAIGSSALKSYSEDGAGGNTACGVQTLRDLKFGSYNVAIGGNACRSLTGISTAKCISNVAVGYNALGEAELANYNVAIGTNALETATTPDYCTVIGYEAGGNATNNQNCTYIGYNTNGVAGENNVVRIGNSAITKNYLVGDLYRDNVKTFTWTPLNSASGLPENAMCSWSRKAMPAGGDYMKAGSNVTGWSLGTSADLESGTYAVSDIGTLDFDSPYITFDLDASPVDIPLQALYVTGTIILRANTFRNTGGVVYLRAVTSAPGVTPVVYQNINVLGVESISTSMFEGNADFPITLPIEGATTSSRKVTLWYRNTAGTPVVAPSSLPGYSLSFKVNGFYV